MASGTATRTTTTTASSAARFAQPLVTRWRCGSPVANWQARSNGVDRAVHVRRAFGHRGRRAHPRRGGRDWPQPSAGPDQPRSTRTSTRPRCQPAGYSSDVYDFDAMGRQAPHHLGVLSHYDAVVWETGNDIILRAPGQVGGTTAKAAVDIELSVRDYLNEGGKLLLRASTTSSPRRPTARTATTRSSRRSARRRTTTRACRCSTTSSSTGWART